jgi:hypothetical protein
MTFGPEILSHKQSVEPQAEVFEPSELTKNYSTSETKPSVMERMLIRPETLEELLGSSLFWRVFFMGEQASLWEHLPPLATFGMLHLKLLLLH